MKPWLKILVFALALVVQNPAFLGAQDMGSPMPQVLYSSDPDIKYPQWVAVESMLGPDGKFDSNYLPPESIEVLELNLRNSHEKIIKLEEFYFSNINQPNLFSIEEVVGPSVLVMAGVVTGKAFGFRGSEPGQLIRLEPAEVFYSKGKVLAEYFIFFPISEFFFNGKKIIKTDMRYPAVPEIGEEVFFAAHPYYHTDPADAFVRLGEAQQLFTVTKSGQVSLPFVFRQSLSPKSKKGDVPKSRAELASLFRSNARRN